MFEFLKLSLAHGTVGLWAVGSAFLGPFEVIVCSVAKTDRTSGLVGDLCLAREKVWS